MTAIVWMAPVALIGHGLIWLAFWNHANGSALSQQAVKRVSGLLEFGCVVLPLVCGYVFLHGHDSAWLSAANTAYFVFCFAVSLIAIPWEYLRRRRAARAVKNVRQSSQIHCMTNQRERHLQSASFANLALLAFPGNQAYELEESEKEVTLKGLPRSFDGLTIAHISDLHFTGAVGYEFFAEAIRRTNAMNADIIAVTGDLVDKPECLDWLPTTVGQLRARLGVYYIFGNHDRKTDIAAARRMLDGQCCLSQSFAVVNIGSQRLLLAGNESPWMPEVPETTNVAADFRILLAHSPDAIDWARRNRFDLMLAGHTHGGQFRIPGYGAFVCPIQKPLEFASGLIESEPTLLHVSRGLSAELPLRLNCRPEITRLVLRSPQRTVRIDSPQEQAVKECPSMKMLVGERVALNAGQLHVTESDR